MIRSRFLSARRAGLALPALLGAAVFSSGWAWAQTRPVFENPPGAATAPGALLLEQAFDIAAEGAAAPRSPQGGSSAAIAADNGASSARALAWKYALGSDDARLSWALAAPLDLSTARSVALKLKSDAPGAVEVWFETRSRGEGAQSLSLRYSATVWSVGGEWQSLDIDRARFSGREVKGGVVQKEPAGSALWEAGWSEIASWGVADSTNTWRLFAGQTRASGARTLWLDDLRVSTGPSSNPAIPAPAAPQAAPQNTPPEPEEDEEDAQFAPGNNGNNGFVPPGALPNGPGANANPYGAPYGGGGYGPSSSSGAAPGYGAPGYGAPAYGAPAYGAPVAQDGAFEGPEEEEGGEAEGGQASSPVQAVVQDARGSIESWVPINATTSQGERVGFKWSFVRLGNRDSMLISPVNAEMLRAFPPESTQKPERDPRVVIRTQAPRLLRLALGATSERDTIVQVAVYESGGGVWTTPVRLSPRRRTFVPILPLANFTNLPTRRDDNGRIDLDRIVAVSLQDIGAQKGMAGPNDIIVRGLTWLY